MPEWDLPDGRILVLEIDGAFHADVLQAADDAKRSRRLTTPTRIGRPLHGVRAHPRAVGL